MTLLFLLNCNANNHFILFNKSSCSKNDLVNNNFIVSVQKNDLMINISLPQLLYEDRIGEAMAVLYIYCKVKWDERCCQRHMLTILTKLALLHSPFLCNEWITFWPNILPFVQILDRYVVGCNQFVAATSLNERCILIVFVERPKLYLSKLPNTLYQSTDYSSIAPMNICCQDTFEATFAMDNSEYQAFRTSNTGLNRKFS